MQWSKQQDDVLVKTSAWLKDESAQQVFRLFGYAGTGKTTLAYALADGVDGEVMFGAFTGKAVHVMKTKGCHNAQTIHSMIYHAKEKSREALQKHETQLVEAIQGLEEEHAEKTPDQRRTMIDAHVDVITLRLDIEKEKKALAQPSFMLNHESEIQGAALVIIDECSMVDARMGNDLLSFGTKVLVLGDPAQLPPVYGSGFFTDCEPDAMLTEIHRQAKDNPIVAMATKVRNQERLEIGTYGESQVARKSEMRKNDVLAVDQILVGRNVTRHKINRNMRRMLDQGNGYLPVVGDRLVCLRNNYNLGLLNGAIWTVMDIGECDEDTERIIMTVKSESSPDEVLLEAHTYLFKGETRTLGWHERRDAEEFDFGYALTVHKSQGSQWNDVMLYDESYCFRKDSWRWLYTGITRAAERITVVQ